MDAKVKSRQDSLSRDESDTERRESWSSSASDEDFVGRTPGSAANGEQVSKSDRVLRFFKSKKKKSNREQLPPTVRRGTSTSDSQYAASGVQSLSTGKESENSAFAPRDSKWSFGESVVPSNLNSTQGSNDSSIPEYPELQRPSVITKNLTQSPERYGVSHPSTIELSKGANRVESSGDQLQTKNLQPVIASSHSPADQEQPTTGLGIKGSNLDRHVDS